MKVQSQQEAMMMEGKDKRSRGQVDGWVKHKPFTQETAVRAPCEVTLHKVLNLGPIYNMRHT